MATRELARTSRDDVSTDEGAINTCPECGGKLLTEGGETRCCSCGLVVDTSRLDRRGPRIYLDDESNRGRTGDPVTNARHDRGLSTEIGYKRDANGNELCSKTRRRISRLRREHNRAKWQSKADRNLGHGCTEIARMVSALGLGQDLREQAATLFRSAQDASLLPGRSIEAMATACVYAACRCAKQPLTLDEVSRISRVQSHRIRNAYSVLNRELGLPVPPQQPAAFVPKLASEVSVSAETRHKASEFAEQAANTGRATGRNPAGVAAACLEIAATETDDEITQEELAAAADVCSATVRSNRDMLKKHINT
ncbi:transcription initiation factor IIB (plasmid) [Halorientalis pallida]|uniref:transcription initiation factor IIB n=1 Tax=Halorientalis pallida TaxID=2479928 RepID=UPI003C6EA7CD